MPQPIEVQGPDGQRYQFPADTSPDVMRSAMAKRYPKPAPQAPVNANPAQQFFTPSQGERANAWAEREMAGGLFPIEGDINEAYRASKQPAQELSYMDALRQSATPKSMLDTAGAMVSGANNMLYAGFDDELANLAGMDGYEQTQDRLRAEKPQAFMGGQAIGGFVPFGQGMQLANPQTIKGAMATGGGLGALQGGAQAYGDADAEGQNRAQSGLQGGVMGGAFGAGLSGGLAAAPAIKQGALNTLERMTPDGAVAQKLRKGGQLDNPTQQAMVEVLDATPDAQSVKSLRLTENLLRNSGLSPDRIAGGFNRIKQLKASGAHPRLSLARLIEREFANEAPEVSQNLRAFLMKVGMDSGKGRAIVTSATDSLRKTQADDLRGQAAYELGSQSRLEASNQAKSNMQGVGALYDEALRQAPRQGEMVDAAKELLGNYPKEVRAAVGKKALAARMSLDQYIEQNPLEAAHWTQSLIKQSEKPIDQAIASQMTDILENSVPGYAGLRKQYADQATRREMVGYVDGGRESKGFGSDLVNKSGKELTADDMVERYRGLPQEHAAAADLSVRDAITDPLRLGKAAGADEFGRDMAGARLSTLQREGVLDTMERMLGERGSRLSKQVKSFIDERQFAADIDPRTGSNTMNKATAQATGAAPVSGFMGRSFGGADGSVPSSLLLDGVLATTGNLPVATLARGLPAGIGRMFQPREKTRNALADLLLRGSGGSDPTRSMFTGGGGVPPVNALNDGLLANNMPPPVAGDPMRPSSGPIPGGPRDAGVPPQNALADVSQSPVRNAPKPQRPQTLTGFIRAQGGINDEGGEISAVLGGTNTVPGVISNVRRSGPESISGKQIDYMIEAAIEEGFLPPGATANDFFDALSRDVSAMGDDAGRVYPEYGYRSDGVFDYLTWLQSKQ